MEVGYEQTSYTISELNNSVEICVHSTSPGISAEYDIIVQTQHVTSELKLHSFHPLQNPYRFNILFTKFFKFAFLCEQ